MSSRSLAALDMDRPPVEAVAIPLEPLWLDGYCVFGEPPHQFFVSPDWDVLVMGWPDVWIGSPSREVSELVAPGIKVGVLH